VHQRSGPRRLHHPDYSTFNFLQWYVAEQHEEEKLFKSIVDRLSLVGEDGKGLYFIDKELAELAKGAPASIMDGNA
jgi:ferritin